MKNSNFGGDRTPYFGARSSCKKYVRILRDIFPLKTQYFDRERNLHT